MPIYRKHRALSEKTTSIEDPIEVVQRGVITFVPSKGRTFFIPTQITNPVSLRIFPMHATSAQAFVDSSAGGMTWYSNLKLHYATNAASSGFGSIASNVLLEEVGKRIRLYNGKLHVATASCYATSAENTELSALTTWRKLEEFGSNAQKYLVVTMPNIASAYFVAKKQWINYEVVGYEY